MGLAKLFHEIAVVSTADMQPENFRDVLQQQNIKGRGHAKIIADFLDKYLAWVVLKPKISFVKFIKVVK